MMLILEKRLAARPDRRLNSRFPLDERGLLKLLPKLTAPKGYYQTTTQRLMSDQTPGRNMATGGLANWRPASLTGVQLVTLLDQERGI